VMQNRDLIPKTYFLSLILRFTYISLPVCSLDLGTCVGAPLARFQEKSTAAATCVSSTFDKIKLYVSTKTGIPNKS